MSDWEESEKGEKFGELPVSGTNSRKRIFSSGGTASGTAGVVQLYLAPEIAGFAANLAMF